MGEISNKLLLFSGGSAGHYTQLVWAETGRLGCGTVYYGQGMLSNNLVCNYAIGGNMMGASVYTQVTIPLLQAHQYPSSKA